MATYLVRIDESFFEGCSRLQVELAVDRMSHWLAATLPRELRVRATLVQTFNEAGTFLVERGGCRPVVTPDEVEDAIEAALAYAIETWTETINVEIEA